MKKTLVKVLTISALLLTGSAANAQDLHHHRDTTLTPAESRELFNKGAAAMDVETQQDRTMITEVSSGSNEDYQDAVSKRVFTHSFLAFERPTVKIDEETALVLFQNASNAINVDISRFSNGSSDLSDVAAGNDPVASDLEWAIASELNSMGSVDVASDFTTDADIESESDIEPVAESNVIEKDFTLESDQPKSTKRVRLAKD